MTLSMKFLKVICLTSILHVFIVGAMTLDKLPPDMMGNIIIKLVNHTGSPQLKRQNEADIPVIVKYVKSISLASKKMCDTINDLYCLTVFLDALTARFSIAQINLIPTIKTPGANLWLEGYLNQSNEYEQFKTMQRILQAANDVYVQSEAFYCKSGANQVAFGQPYLFENQTKQGFFIKKTPVLMLLSTPWGVVNLFCSVDGYGKEIDLCPFWQKFMGRFEMSNAEQIKEQGYSSGSGVRFRLEKFDGVTLPIAQESSEKDCRGREVIHLILQRLQNQQEKGIVKNEPVTKKQVIQQQIGIPVYEKYTHYITSPAVAAKKCVQIFNSLNDQPVSSSGDYGSKKHKVLALGSSDCFLFEIIWNSAMETIKTGKKFKVASLGGRYHVSFGEAYISRLLHKNDSINQELHTEGVRRSKEFEAACENIITDLVTGWQQTNLIEHEYIPHKESEEEWSLFIKAPYYGGAPEDPIALCLKVSRLTEVMNLLAKVTGLDGAIRCNMIEGVPRISLWIKKSCYEDVLKKLCLKVMLTPESMF